MIQLTDDVLSDDMFEECFNFLNPTGSVFDFHNMDVPWSIGRDIVTEEETGLQFVGKFAVVR